MREIIPHLLLDLTERTDNRIDLIKPELNLAGWIDYADKIKKHQNEYE